MEQLLDVDEVSRLLGCAKQTLYKWHHLRQGPRATKVGRLLRYDPQDVRRWLESQSTESA